MEHCFGKVPRRTEGYSTDDNARALWACMEWMRYAARMHQDSDIPMLQALADKYFEFLMWVQRQDGRFHNNVRYDRSFELEVPSDDCQGRSLWAIVTAIRFRRDANRLISYLTVCHQGFQPAMRLRYPRGIAHTLSAASALLRWESSEPIESHWFTAWVRDELPSLVKTFTERLCELYHANSRLGWQWFESSMTYANGVLPWALFQSCTVRDDTRVLRIAEEALLFLIERMTTPEGYIRPVGNREWATPNGSSLWDQQPLEVMKLELACAAALEVSPREAALYRETMERCIAWFQGANDAGLALVDMSDGGCCDGLTENGLNHNQGAESTLAYLLTEAIYHNSLKQGGRSDVYRDADTEIHAADTRVSRV